MKILLNKRYRELLISEAKANLMDILDINLSEEYDKKIANNAELFLRISKVMNNLKYCNNQINKILNTK